MSTTDVRVTERARARAAEAETVLEGLTGLLPTIGTQPDDPVKIPVPGLRVRTDEAQWSAFLSDPAAAKRRALTAYLRSLLALDGFAKSKNLSLAQAAAERGLVFRRTLENAWVSLLEQNRAKEQAIRWSALFFSNLQDSAATFRGKIFAIDATAEEIASDTGRKRLAEELKRYVRRPDARSSRGYLVVQGWVGSPTNLHRLGRVIDDHRALLISDAPSFDEMEKLRDAATNGGLLEELGGEGIEHRHMMLLGNRGRARKAFRGRFAAEKSDVFIPLSGPWFGSYLDNIARGMPWKPTIGYRNPIAGIDGVELDLLLEKNDGFALYLKHRVNPCIRLSADSRNVVVWGPDTLSRMDGGVQMGVAIVEMILIRYTEWLINQYGLLDDLEEGERVLRSKLSAFMTRNSGAGRMFRAGSRVSVQADHESRSYTVDYALRFREVAERATIRLVKPARVDPGQVEASSSHA